MTEGSAGKSSVIIVYPFSVSHKSSIIILILFSGWTVLRLFVSQHAVPNSMNPTFSVKCIMPYICGANRNAVHGVYWLGGRRLKSDGGDDNDPPERKSHKNQAAVDKLNELLKTMKKGNDDRLTVKNVELAKPRELARKAEQNRQRVDESKLDRPLGEKLADAASSVARSMGGNTARTESELLNLLRIYNSEPDCDAPVKIKKSAVELGDLLSGMKIDRSRPKATSAEFKNVDRAQRVRDVLDQTSGSSSNQKSNNYRKPMDSYLPINLFSSEPLDVFKNFEENTNRPKLSTWDRLHKNSLKTAVTHPPINIYEQMVIWTEQGKLWKFPIDNEQGMDDELNVFFAEHVFLEPLIDEWCPTKGPIRHFMELVCVGLSKNPFLSVEEKKDHINWFRQYFYEKNQILKEIEALEIKSLPENDKEYYKPTIPNE